MKRTILLAALAIIGCGPSDNERRNEILEKQVDILERSVPLLYVQRDSGMAGNVRYSDSIHLEILKKCDSAKLMDLRYDLIGIQ